MFLVRKCIYCDVRLRLRSSLVKNYYDALGVKKDATQAEIKLAYYELSKLHHPDTSSGDENSSIKFREITNAYETLGNVKSRKLYDRGLVIGQEGTILRRDEEEMDPTTRFYRQREKRSQVPTFDNRETVYNYDAWTKAHYSKSFQRSQEKKTSYKVHKSNEIETQYALKKDLVVILMSLLAVIYFAILGQSDPDDIVIPDSRPKNDR